VLRWAALALTVLLRCAALRCAALRCAGADVLALALALTVLRWAALALTVPRCADAGADVLRWRWRWR
jgi:hypothetical protein